MYRRYLVGPKETDEYIYRLLLGLPACCRQVTINYSARPVLSKP